MASLGDRNFQSFRRVWPGRTTTDPDLDSRHREEYAQAVVAPDGGPITGNVEGVLGEILVQLKMLNMQMRFLTNEEVSLSGE